ncbi:MAG: quinolinate synthase NadA [Candidatus Gracilibacteria bacterium]|nr:quinolinate synthase NadA [Candidatus Gracilibacteria bacterium]
MSITTETRRLYEKLQHVGWSKDECETYAPLTLEINQLKKEQDAIILAHSYQSPDIVYGVADFVGDSYGLSKIAAKHKAQKIIFCSVHFMAETAKILSPEKEVLVPTRAGCSLADSISAEDVKKLKEKHPGVPVACYVNTTAEVKAESDVCVTSSNVLQIIEDLPSNEVIFIPDKYMADYIKRHTKKNIITWDGVCVVHEEFTSASIQAVREQYPGVEILVHPECSSSVIDEADMVGSTSQMLDHVKDSKEKQFMIVSECGLADRVKAEVPKKKVVGACSMCPYMKSIQLKDILIALKSPREDQIISLTPDIVQKSKACLDKMFEMTQN